MITDAFVRAGCGSPLGPSEFFVDWSTSPTATVSASSPPASAPEDPVDLRALWTSSIQVAALACMMLLSTLVGVAMGAADAMGGPQTAGYRARTNLIAAAQELSVEQVARMQAETERTLASVEAELGPVSVW